MLVDVRNTGLTGKEAEHLFDEVGITANKNTIPFDPAKPICNKWCSSRYACIDYTWS